MYIIANGVEDLIPCEDNAVPINLTEMRVALVKELT